MNPGDAPEMVRAQVVRSPTLFLLDRVDRVERLDPLLVCGPPICTPGSVDPRTALVTVSSQADGSDGIWRGVGTVSLSDELSRVDARLRFCMADVEAMWRR